MGGLYFPGARKVGNGAGNLEDSVVGAGGEGKLLHSILEEVAKALIESTMLTDLTVRHESVGGGTGAGKTLELELAGANDPFPNRGGAFTFLLAAQFFDGERGCLNMDIDAIKKRAADLCTVPLDLSGCAAGFPAFCSRIAIGGRVHSGNEHDGRGKGDFPSAAGYGDLAVFEWLAKYFES